MSQVAEFDQANNPYRSTSAHSPGVLEAAFPGTSEAELRAFVGAKADYYLRKWAPRLNDPSADPGMNWAAFFLTAFWLAYRKMYWITFLFQVVVVVLAVAQHVVFVGILGSKTAPLAVGLIVNIMTAMVCGFFGNSWYLAHTQRAIGTARAQGLEGEQLLFALAQRGGTSWLAVFALMFIGVILVVLLLFGLALAMVLSQTPR